MIEVFGYAGAVSEELRRAAASAALVVGGQRHLDALEVPEERRVVLGAITPAIEALSALPSDAPAVVVASGDPLFYGVVRRIRAAGLPVRVHPAVSSLQLAFASVALPWDDALWVSVHGNDPAPALAAVQAHPKVGVLTDRVTGLPQLAHAVAGQGRWFVLAERLGEADERVRVLSEDEAREVTDIAQPNVVLVLAHHPDDPQALGVQVGAPMLPPVERSAAESTVVERSAAESKPPTQGHRFDSGLRPPLNPREPRIAQLTNSPAARARADHIDAVLGGTIRFDGPASQSLPAAWATCDLIVSHLALGATTRLLAPLLHNKKTDPGVVVIDEAGRFVVPLVGGHVGGANELARRIADGIDATAVVTTATDALGLPGLDTLGWATSGDLAGVTRTLLDGEPVELVREHPWPLPALPDHVWERGRDKLERRGTHVKTLTPPETFAGRIVVTDARGFDSAALRSTDDVPTVFLHPRSLVVGLGCNRGTAREQLEELLDATLDTAGLAKASIAALTSVDAKADEPGLQELAAALGVPFMTYPADELAAIDVPNPSDAPARAVGTPSVAEASVLAHGAALVVPKAKTPDATCAIGRLAPRGKLYIVGLGPGADDLLTPRAKAALAASSMVIGYRPYVAQIRHLLRPGTEVSATGMGTEQARTALAIDEARTGRTVALVAGGDPAIYAMASPTLEQGTPGIDVEVIPGVTAELAASAILGAPLGHDHVTISLSDLHTDWNVIERRLQAAAEGDFVVALYNPRSRKRVEHLPRALEILGAHRPPTTPVAVVQDASRPTQHARVATLADFDPEWVDMHSLVIVGSSTTRMVPTGEDAEVMVTPRDYHWMPR